MNITINVECTPEEARRYMGLPDVAPMQEAMLKEMQERMMDNMKSMQPSEMMKAWLPIGLNGWLDMQKKLWTQMTSVAAGTGDDPN